MGLYPLMFFLFIDINEDAGKSLSCTFTVCPLSQDPLHCRVENLKNKCHNFFVTLIIAKNNVIHLDSLWENHLN